VETLFGKKELNSAHKEKKEKEVAFIATTRLDSCLVILLGYLLYTQIEEGSVQSKFKENRGR